MPSLNQGIIPGEESLPEGFVDCIVTEPDLSRIDVGTTLGQPKPESRIGHRARVGIDMAEWIDQRRRPAPDGLQAPERRHDGALMIAPGVRYRRHVAVDHFAIPILD